MSLYRILQISVTFCKYHMNDNFVQSNKSVSCIPFSDDIAVSNLHENPCNFNMENYSTSFVLSYLHIISGED